MDTVGKRIKNLRTDKGLTQQQVADAVGIKQPSLGDIETGESKNPAALTLIKLAKFFEIDPEYLLTGKGPKQTVESLTPEETELLTIFRSLSGPGKAYVLARAQDLQTTEMGGRSRDGGGDGEDETSRPPSGPRVQ